MDAEEAKLRLENARKERDAKEKQRMKEVKQHLAKSESKKKEKEKQRKTELEEEGLDRSVILVAKLHQVAPQKYLPDDLIVCCFEYLNAKEICQSQLVCHKWNDIVRSNEQQLWRAKCIEYWVTKDKKMASNHGFMKIVRESLSADWKRLFFYAFKGYQRTAHTREDPPFFPSQILKGHLPTFYSPPSSSKSSSTPSSPSPLHAGNGNNTNNDDNNTRTSTTSDSHWMAGRETFWDTTPPASTLKYPNKRNIAELSQLLLGASEFLTPSPVLWAVQLLPDFYWVIFETRGGGVEGMVDNLSSFYLSPTANQSGALGSTIGGSVIMESPSATPKKSRKEGDGGTAIPAALQNKTFLLPPILNTAVILEKEGMISNARGTQALVDYMARTKLCASKRIEVSYLRLLFIAFRVPLFPLSTKTPGLNGPYGIISKAKWKAEACGSLSDVFFFNGRTIVLNTIAVADKKSKKALVKAKKGEKEKKKEKGTLDSKQKEKLGLGKSLVRRFSSSNVLKAMMEDEQPKLYRLVVKREGGDVNGEGGEEDKKKKKKEKKGSSTPKTPSKQKQKEGEGKEEFSYRLYSVEKKEQPTVGSEIRKAVSPGSQIRRKGDNDNKPLFFGKDLQAEDDKKNKKKKGSNRKKKENGGSGGGLLSKAEWTMKLLEKKNLKEAKVVPVITLSNTTIA